jgi:hypothetical protein
VESEYGGIEVFGRQPRRRAAPRRRSSPAAARARLGIVALLASLATVVLTAVGIASAMAGHWDTGTALAYAATATSVVGVLGGAAAVVIGRGRRFGAVAIVVGILASPLLLTRLLDLASGLG